MKEHIITFLISSITAIMTFLFTIRINQNSQKAEIKKEQKFKYFLPFKDYSIEFLKRLQHIEQRLFENRRDMKLHFTQNFENKNLDWYQIDWIDSSILKPGGYFIASTIYMHCILFSKIRLVQQEYPFITLDVEKNIDELINDLQDVQLERCMNELTKSQNKFEQFWAQLLKIRNSDREIDIKELIVAIRVATIMKNGIPYSLHNSFGDYVMKGNKEINYDEFCKILNNPEEKIKFLSIIKFWTELIDEEGQVNTQKLNSLRGLILILKLVEYSDLKY